MKELKFKAVKNGVEYSITHIDFVNGFATGVNSGEWEEFDIEELIQL